MLLDMTKAWTLDYVRRELPKIPSSLPVIILVHCLVYLLTILVGS